jgi:hypothetical protein
MNEVCAQLEQLDLYGLDTLEFEWPGSYTFLVCLTANICDYNRPEDTVARMLSAVRGGMVEYRRSQGWNDRARWRAFADGVWDNLGPDADRSKFLAALDDVQRDIVENEDMSLYYEEDDEPQGGAGGGPRG